jgi:hypothetical protein
MDYRLVTPSVQNQENNAIRSDALEEARQLRQMSTSLRQFEFAGTIVTMCLAVSSLPLLIAAVQNSNSGWMVVFGFTLAAAFFAGMFTGSLKSTRRKIMLQGKADADMLDVCSLLDVYDEFLHLKRPVGYNIDMWQGKSRANIETASVNLVRAMNIIHASDGNRLTPHQRAMLRELLNDTNQYLVAGAIKAMEVIGTADDIAALDSFIQEASDSEPWQVSGAQRAAEAIRDRLTSLEEARTLVRASNIPNAQFGELVRPVTPDGLEQHPDQLLRVSNSE